MKRFLCVLMAVCCFGLAMGCNDKSGKIKVYMPDGATAISMSYMMANKTTLDNYEIEYTVVPPSTINGYLDGNADFVIMPINAAAATFAASPNSQYKLLSVVTHGMLFLLGQQGADDDLTGKNVGVIGGLNNLPHRVLKYILTARGYNLDANEVTITPFSAPYDARDALLAGTVDCAVIAEPDVTNYLNGAFKDSGIEILSNLQDEWNESENWLESGYNGYAQACLMVKTTLNSDFIDAFIDECKQNEAWAKNNHVAAIDAIKNNYLSSGTSTIGNLTQGKEAEQIENCNIRFDTQNLKAYIEACFARLGINNPDQSFYYQ